MDTQQQETPSVKTRYIPRPTKRIPRGQSRKLQAHKALALMEMGVTIPDAAKACDVVPSTLYRFLDKIDHEKQALIKYKDNRADFKALLQVKADDKMVMIIDTITPDTILTMSEPAKKGYLDVLNNISGTHFDKERVERGESIGVLDYHVVSVNIQADFEQARKMLEQARALKASTTCQSGGETSVVVDAEEIR